MTGAEREARLMAMLRARSSWRCWQSLRVSLKLAGIPRGSVAPMKREFLLFFLSLATTGWR